MMRTLLRPEHRCLVHDRLNGLRSDDTPGWGSLDAGGMLAHLHFAMETTFGPPVSGSGWGQKDRPFLKWFILYAPFRWPRGVKVPRSLFPAAADDFEAQRAAVLQTLEYFDTDPGTEFGRHPLMGRLSFREWGRLHYRHFDHHLRQFGR
jgi:hypothetical protein